MILPHVHEEALYLVLLAFAALSLMAFSVSH